MVFDFCDGPRNQLRSYEFQIGQPREPQRGRHRHYVGISKNSGKISGLFSLDEKESVTAKDAVNINGYEYLKQLDIGYVFYAANYTDKIIAVLNSNEKTIVHIPNVNARESTKDNIREVEHILEELGEWQGTDPKTDFQLVKLADGTILKVADLVDDDPAKRDKVSAALKDSALKFNRDQVDIIIALGMAKEGFDWIWCEHALTVSYRSKPSTAPHQTPWLLRSANPLP